MTEVMGEALAGSIDYPRALHITARLLRFQIGIPCQRRLPHKAGSSASQEDLLKPYGAHIRIFDGKAYGLYVGYQSF